ncbi:MAG: GNAT family N-acetyltransferase [Clostridia bacterium]|nr:GNAT family N-acetyltransferase [Clostridia bacterium]
MIIRSYKQTDCEGMYALFCDTVRSVNCADYTEEQLAAWVGADISLEEWDLAFTRNYTVVALENGQIVGFGEIDKTGYLDKLYVHKDFLRRGIGSAICDMLEQNFWEGKITVHASITARPFFESRGYTLVKEQTAVRNGIHLTNFVMEKECSFFDE